METQALVQQALPATAEHDRLTNVQRLGKILAASGYFQDAREMAQAAVKVMAGDELGIPPIAAMMGIHVIKSKVVLSGNLIASRIRAHGYDYRHKQFDSKGCVLEFLSKPDANGKRTLLGESSFTIEDAQAAGLTGSENYKKYPRNMCFNRAISNGAKWFTPEVTCGLPIYTPEELGVPVNSEGEIVHEEQRGAQQQVAEQKIAQMKPAPVEQKPESQAAPPELACLWLGMKDYASTVATIGQFKADIQELTGSDREYYSILAHHGMAHSNEIKGRRKGDIRAVVRDLFEYVERVRANLHAGPQEPVVITDEDVPIFGVEQPEQYGV